MIARRRVLSFGVLIVSFCAVFYLPRLFCNTSTNAAELDSTTRTAIESRESDQSEMAIAVGRVADAGRDQSAGRAGEKQVGAGVTPHSAGQADSTTRNAKTLFELVVVANPMVPEAMFRNDGLNPLDVSITGATKESITGYCQRVAPEIARLAALMSTAAARDLLIRIERNEAASLDLKSYKDGLTQEQRTAAENLESNLTKAIADRRGVTVDEVRRDPTTSVVIPSLMFDRKPMAYVAKGGRVYSASTSELPNALRLSQARKWVYFEVAQTICGAFVAERALDPGAADSLMALFVETLDRELPDK